MNNKAINRYVKRKYRELQQDEFYLEYFKYISESYQNIRFNKELFGPLRNYNIKDFYNLIDNFFTKYYGDLEFSKSIDEKISIYSREELLEFIKLCDSKDTLGIVNSRVRISKELCHDLLVNTASFLFPLYKDDWQILLLDLNSIETVLNLIHEYTHKIHYFLFNGFDEETSVITEMVAYYNTATFIKYALENNISSYELNLAINSTEFTIAEEIGSIPIYNFVEEQQDFNFLNEKEKELIARYFDMDYFPPSDYYHHLSYYLYKELFNKNRNFSIEEHTQYLKEVMCKKKVKELIKW